MSPREEGRGDSACMEELFSLENCRKRFCKNRNESDGQQENELIDVYCTNGSTTCKTRALCVDSADV